MLDYMGAPYFGPPLSYVIQGGDRLPQWSMAHNEKANIRQVFILEAVHSPVAPGRDRRPAHTLY